MIRRLRRNRALVLVGVALLVVSVCLPAIAAQLHAVLTPLGIVAPPTTVAARRERPARANEQTKALLSVLRSRAPPLVA